MFLQLWFLHFVLFISRIVWRPWAKLFILSVLFALIVEKSLPTLPSILKTDYPTAKKVSKCHDNFSETSVTSVEIWKFFNQTDLVIVENVLEMILEIYSCSIRDKILFLWPEKNPTLNCLLISQKVATFFWDLEFLSVVHNFQKIHCISGETKILHFKTEQNKIRHS